MADQSTERMPQNSKWQQNMLQLKQTKKDLDKKNENWNDLSFIIIENNQFEIMLYENSILKTFQGDPKILKWEVTNYSEVHEIKG